MASYLCEVFLKPLDKVFNMQSFTVTNANQVKGITAIGLYTCYGLSAEVKDAQGNPIRPADGHTVQVSAERNDPSNDQMEKRPNIPVPTSKGPMIQVEYTCTPVNATEPPEYEGWVYLRHLS